MKFYSSIDENIFFQPFYSITTHRTTSWQDNVEKDSSEMLNNKIVVIAVFFRATETCFSYPDPNCDPALI